MLSDDYYMSYNFFMALNSAIAIMTATTAAIKSDIGPAYNMPSIPRNSGKIIINGNKNNICLVNDKNIPFTGFPIEVKNVAVIGWRKFRPVNNKNILK